MQRRRQCRYSEVAVATHKRYLGRPKLTGIQSAGLNPAYRWGKMRGAAPRSLQAMNAGELLEEIAGLINLERFTAAIKQAREEGYRGQHALNRAHAILWPKPTPA
jgi:hypothetical protein